MKLNQLIEKLNAAVYAVGGDTEIKIDGHNDVIDIVGVTTILGGENVSKVSLVLIEAKVED